MIKEYLQRKRDGKEKYKELEDDFNRHKKLEERQKSPNERELEKYEQEAREKIIECKLRKYRDNEVKKVWGKEANLIKNNKKLYATDNIFKKQKRMF